MAFHLAQANWARMLAPLDSPRMADFVRQLDAVNRVADAAPGFVWRLQDDAGDATAIRVFDDEKVLFNLSVWESVEALRAYVYKADHGAVLRQRARWFEPADRPTVALWWIPKGTLPDAEEGRRRLELMWELGPTAEAFSIRQWFGPPAAS